jgi:hypothetical protein
VCLSLARTSISNIICHISLFFVQRFMVRNDSSISWYWWNYWPALSCHNRYVGISWEVIVCFIDIGGIVEHHCLSSLFIRWRMQSDGTSSHVLVIKIKIVTKKHTDIFMSLFINKYWTHFITVTIMTVMIKPACLFVYYVAVIHFYL